MSEYHFVEYGYKDIPDGIWNAWMECSRDWHAEPTHTPLWMRDQPRMTSTIPHAKLLVGMDGSGKYLGFWPYQVIISRIKGVLPVRYCCPWGGEYGWDPGIAPHCRFWAICSPEPPEGFPESFVNAFLQHTKFTKLNTGSLQENHPLAAAWEATINKNRVPFLKSYHPDAVVGKWNSFEDYLKSLGKRQRYIYIKKYRQHVESGKLQVEHINAWTPESFLKAIERIKAIYSKSWKPRAGVNSVNLMLPGYLSNFAARINAFVPSGGLHIVFITVDGADAAFWVGISNGTRYISLQTAYDEGYNQYSVGYLAMMESFKYSIEHGMRTNNLLNSYEDYKKNIGAEIVLSSAFWVYSRSITGRLLWLVKRLKWDGDGKDVVRNNNKGYIYQRSDLNS